MKRESAKALRQNWGLALAFLAAATITPLLWIQLQPRQPDLPGYEYSKGATQGYYPGGASCQPQVLATIADRRKASSERERCAKETEDHRLKRYDLTEQARAANAAEAQARTNYDLAWMGLYGTIGGFLTLIAAAAAAFYAREAAKRTAESVHETRRIGEAQTRAYLSVSKCTVMFKDGRPSIQITIANSGQSPALRVRWHAKIGFMVDKEGTVVRSSETAQKYRNFTYSVPAQGTSEVLYTNCGEFELGAQEIEAMKDDLDVTMSIHVFVNGWDVFKKPASVEANFLHIFRASPPNLSPIEVSPTGFIEDEDEA